MSDGPVNPIFLTMEEVLEIHQDQITRYGGSDGILNRGSLESALAQPQATDGSQFLHGDVYEMAAVYLHHLARNHAFADGNKRVATVSAIVFLALNGYDLEADDDELEQIVLSVARGESDRAAVAEFFRRNCVASTDQ
ncbi:MAG: type II toxin-antitoxin system death-on-curing family toxin [Planctomycetota bacterium]|nr:MAG: type II toxin-antitoxin system death-on-curing family toxin [Planctomycetota bacterium]REJ91725.1 MAG: type II toxin-antitoxin system death-on-curing family toxin [Planctomycetota bacterium]REK20899.1 MAG: type II toxin-antitoxin system death-on-curing family toxin [Planctomycetota bacterium]REK27457.1 MAG: type II toxin-antitoxin system death-on-curing family toxin [Planctomycetota bacterium]